MDGCLARRHKSELKKLRKQDPEFFEFLQENDADLLEFDDDDAEEEDFDGDESFQFGNRPKEELTSEVLKQTVERARKGALKDIKLLQGMFKLACNPTIDSDDNEEEEEQGRIPFTISSPEIYEEVMTNAIQHVHLSWARFLQVVTPLQSKAIAKLSANKKWRKLQSSVLGFFKTICTMLQSIGTMDRHHQVALFLLRSLESYIPYLAPLPRLTRSLAKLLSGMLTARINDNAQNEDNKHNFNEVRGQVLLRLRQMSIQVPGNAGEEAFRLVYLHFARACKTCTEMNSENIAFIVRCITELYKSDAAMAYQQAFLYIRQLALHLRVAFIKKGDKAIAPVRSWQYMHCIRLWTSVICTMPSEGRGLGVLVYPLVQIMQGMLTAVQSPYFAPMRFHLTQCAHQLAAHSQMFIPMSLPLTELLEYQEFFNKPTPSTDAPPKLQYLLTLPPNSWGKKVVKETVLQEIVRLLRIEAELYKAHPGFPEYVFIIQRRLRTFAKKTTMGQHRELTRVLADQLADMANVTKQDRLQAGSVPIETTTFEPLLGDNMPSVVERVGKKATKKLLATTSASLKKRAGATGPTSTADNKAKTSAGNDKPLKSALKGKPAAAVEESEDDAEDDEDSGDDEDIEDDDTGSDVDEGDEGSEQSFDEDKVGAFNEDEF